MPQPSHHPCSTADFAAASTAGQQSKQFGSHIQNHSQVSSCAVDSALNSCPMDWSAGMPSAAAGAEPQPQLRVPMLGTTIPNTMMGTRRAAGAPCSEDPMSSAVAAAAAVANPWAWLSDVATGVVSSTAGAVAGPAPAAEDRAASLQYHTASRRLFDSSTSDPKVSMQWKLQQQAEQLQAELALATQQLQLHSIGFNGAPPALTMAR